MSDEPAPRDASLPDGVARRPADFRLTFTDDRLVWAGERRPGLPILHWPDGTVCEPALLYFGYSAEVARAVTSTMRIEASAIREFLAFLWRRGKRWYEADDGLLRGWRTEQLEGTAADPGARRPSARQVERKIAMTLDFFRHLPDALCDIGAGTPAHFVGPAQDARSPITTKEVVSMTPHGRHVGVAWIGAARGTARQVRKPILRDEVVSRVLARLRTAAVDRLTDNCPGWTRGRSLMSADRDWLVGRCGAEAGLRSEEVSRLSLAALAAALAEEGVGGRPGKPLSGPDALSSLATDPAARSHVLDGLEELEASGREELGVEVSCKGRARKAPFPIQLVVDLLDIGIWTVRNAQIGHWESRRPGYMGPPLVFLSWRTGLGFRPGSLGDLVKDAFTDIGVLASNHRLRAHFGMARAIHLLEGKLALNGFRYDEAVERWVLRQVADAMGHADASTTVAHYVDKALMRVVGARNETALAGMIEVHRALLARGKSLGRADFTTVAKVIRELPGDRPSGGVSR